MTDTTALIEARAQSISPYEGQVTIDARLLHSLWCYGNLRPVEGVVYMAGTHRQCLDIVDGIFRDRAIARAALASVAPTAPQIVATLAPSDQDRAIAAADALGDASHVDRLRAAVSAAHTPPAPALWGHLCSGSGDGWRETDVIVRAYDADTIARYRERPEQWSMQPLYLGGAATPVPAPALWAPVAGRIGLTRDGRKVTDIGHDEDVNLWYGRVDGILCAWHRTGKSITQPGVPYHLDLVACADEVASHV